MAYTEDNDRNWGNYIGNVHCLMFLKQIHIFLSFKGQNITSVIFH